MNKSAFKYLIPLLLILLLVNCKRKPPAESAEGQIKFKISYAQEKVGGYSTSFLPKEMIMEYSNNMVKSTIAGGLGFFVLVNVSNLKSYQHTTWLKFIDKKYIYEGDKRESPCCFGMLADMQLEFTNKTKEITGLICKHAIASFRNNEIEPFDIWYTDELGIVNPNSNSPFNDIPGVLLEFNTLMGNANMHMVATSRSIQKIPPKQFMAPNNYRPVTKEEIDRILEALMN